MLNVGSTIEVYKLEKCDNTLTMIHADAKPKTKNSCYVVKHDEECEVTLGGRLSEYQRTPQAALRIKKEQTLLALRNAKKALAKHRYTLKQIKQLEEIYGH